MILIQFALLFISIINLSISTSINCKFDTSPHSIDARLVSRVEFKLIQINNYTSQLPYKAITGLSDVSGNFSFDDLPINQGINETTNFVLMSSSIDYNLKPNRILIQFTNLVYPNETIELKVKAFKNYFGREYIANPKAINPDQLVEISVDPYIRLSLVHEASSRLYYQYRSGSLLTSGPLGNILNSPWKIAGIIVVLSIMIFPTLIEKLDPAASELMKEEALKKKKEQYVVKK
ncbi:hypothetical protein TBLA_0D03070 [Henningerozyma blattae CBS 6284]|uniref:Protein SOP4 n=1 Tax=Henningerozyma blattae (strain ATCC 34711 / CBS 6284 / DSM 70876 / NBRC 10599 / NRRL Y-10934 / UCD 77-7) TaxID=1071380 RepID=I2H355_HENB6|nr:hypothetical protein TBLA_0D03070 [Tetrapisispora blattae CBS 6284]CCH60807.1 hypothetical protein TBLA_0D03070 [Tetrapisispora blattae CBS 6284]